jgi:uncharacterized membrane protein YcaP (DUF421 family)
VAQIGAMTQSLFDIGVPVTEKVIRTILVYAAILLLLRIFGKRTAAQLNSFDLVVLLLLSNVVQNAIIGPDNSLLGGLLGAAVLVLANDAIVRVVRRNARIDQAMEGRQTTLIRNGAFIASAMRRLGIGTADLESSLRGQGAEHVSQVENADLFPSGAVVVDLSRDARSATVGDVARLEAKLEAMRDVLDGIARAGS